MPNLPSHSSGPRYTLDDLRASPSTLLNTYDLRDTLGLKSYGAVVSLVKAGRLPPPYRIGGRCFWEARHALHALGIATGVQDAAATTIRGGKALPTAA